MDIDQAVLQRISPTTEQRALVQAVSSDLMKKVTKAASETGSNLRTKLVGSVAKDTYVYRPDIDIFVLFPVTTAAVAFIEQGLRIGKKVLDGEERYAEHPYIHGVYQEFEVDIVPCYAISDPNCLKSAVDRTPFHTDFVKGHLKEEQKDQVRLLKQFMKGVGVYGAEAKIRGFSGYLVELLIMKYGDFRTCLKDASAWRDGTTLSLGEPGNSTFDTPLVFYDPVDLSRNVSSALSIDTFACFIFACHEYLREARISFFFPNPAIIWSGEEIERKMRDRGTKLLGLRIMRPRLIDDNLYPQARRSLEGVKKVLENHEFVVLNEDFMLSDTKITFMFELLSDELPPLKKHRGPPVWVDQSERFLQKWTGNAIGDPYIQEGRWMANIRRPFRRAADMIREEIQKASLGSDMKDLSSLEIFDHDQVLKGNLGSEVTELLDKPFPWLR